MMVCQYGFLFTKKNLRGLIDEELPFLVLTSSLCWAVEGSLVVG